jgi:DNA-binding beta-propeller fold protein YncE
MKKILLLSFFVLPILLMAQKSGYQLKTSFPIKSNGGWDYITVYKNKLYVSHGTQVNILNKVTGDSIGVIANTTGVHGIAFDPKQNIGFTSNGKLNNVYAFNITTNEIIATIPTGENPDAIMYDAFTKTIITCNGRGKNLTFIDPVSFKVLGQVDVGGKPETAVSDELGNIYVNVEDKNEIVKVDAVHFKALAHWSIHPVEEPTGLAIDTKSKRLFAAGNKMMVILNYETGKTVTTFPIDEGCDGLVFDKKQKLIFTSNGEGTLSIIKEINANQYQWIENLPTQKSARTIAIDESTGIVYLPAANFEPQPAGSVVNKRTPVIPGTFKVLVVAKNAK